MTHASALRHWLVPHRGNRHQPRILSAGSLSAIASALLLLQLGYNFAVTGQWRVLSYATDISHTAVIDLTNRERAAAGLRQLRENEALDRAARLKAQDMFGDNYWAHVAPDGTEPWYFFEAAGYDYIYAGENLAKSFDTSSGVIAGWMGSPGHRANLLNESYRDIGIAVMNGVLLGEETTLVVALYGASADSRSLAGSDGTPLVISEEPPDAEQTVASAGPQELAPSPREYSAARPLLLTQTMSWGQLLSFGAAGALLPVYAMTHVQMLRHQLHHAARWLWRRRLLELAGVITLIGSLLLSGWGSVG